jgi:hypothetical protein
MSNPGDPDSADVVFPGSHRQALPDLFQNPVSHSWYWSERNHLFIMGKSMHHHSPVEFIK